MADGPVSVVRQCVHCFDGHHGAFERGHTIEGQGNDQEADNRVVTQLLPCTRKGHDAVDHAAPGWCEQNQGEHHTDGLSPVRQGGVMQVVRTCPHVDRNQCPEVYDGQTIGINRATRLLGYEVVHHAQEASRQEEAHSVVAIPPLHHGIHGTGVYGVGFCESNRDGGAVDNVQ